MVKGALGFLAGCAPDPATAVAGIISSLSNVRPGVVSYTRGFTGAPSDATIGPDGNIWVNEGRDDKIAKVDLRTKTATEFAVPPGTSLHDLQTGPDGKLWWIGVNGRRGTLELKECSPSSIRGR